MRLGRVSVLPALTGRVSKYRAQRTWVEPTPPYRLHDHLGTARARGIDTARLLADGKADGWTLCDSLREAGRYAWLLDQQDKGRITGLRRQVPYPLHALSPEGELVCVGRYIADVVYTDAVGAVTVEDVKGIRTPFYCWKKRHVEAEYGIRIWEV